MELPSSATLLETVLRPSALLAAAAVLAVALRKAPARVRGAVWGIALMGSLVVPVGARWAPGLELPLPSAVASLFPGAHVNALPTSPSEPLPESRASISGKAAIVVSSAPAADVETAGPEPLPWSAAIVLAWALGFALAFAWQAAGALRVRKLIARAEVLETPDWQRLMAREASAVGLDAPPRLLLTGELGSPATWGVRSPVVLLPDIARCWIEERREVVVRHELVHIARADWAVRTVARLACAVYWFNPLAWWAWRRLNVEQELACDQEVVALGARASTYAGHLLGIARASRPAPALAGAALEMARKTHLEDRIMAILDPRIRRHVPWTVLAPALVVTVALVPVIAAVRPAVAAPTSVTTSSPARATESNAIGARIDTVTSVGTSTSARASISAATDGATGTTTRTTTSSVVTTDPEIRRIVGEMRELERQIEAETTGIHEVEEAMRPHLEEIEARATKLGEQRAAEVEARLEPYLERIQAIEAEMEPIHAEIADLQGSLEHVRVDAEVDTGPLAEELEKLSRELTARGERVPADEVMDRIQEVMESVHERIAASMREMRPQLEQLETMHQRLEPFHERMEQIQKEMEPVLADVERIQAEMEPDLAGLDQLHASLEPMQEHMEKIQRSIEPLTKQMGVLGDQLRDALRGQVRSILERDLGAVAAPGAPFDEAADRLLERANIHLEDDALELRISRREARRVLEDLVAPRRRASASESDMNAAIGTAAASLRRLEIPVN
jgi:beta-lactamase regulating signal transducer with metallopeptidase domain/archaellum component FlaC